MKPSVFSPVGFVTKAYGCQHDVWRNKEAHSIPNLLTPQFTCNYGLPLHLMLATLPRIFWMPFMVVPQWNHHVPNVLPHLVCTNQGPFQERDKKMPWHRHEGTIFGPFDRHIAQLPFCSICTAQPTIWPPEMNSMFVSVAKDHMGNKRVYFASPGCFKCRT